MLLFNVEGTCTNKVPGDVTTYHFKLKNFRSCDPTQKFLWSNPGGRLTNLV